MTFYFEVDGNMTNIYSEEAKSQSEKDDTDENVDELVNKI